MSCDQWPVTRARTVAKYPLLHGPRRSFLMWVGGNPCPPGTPKAMAWSCEPNIVGTYCVCLAPTTTPEANNMVHSNDN